jgi:hypothetical protein
MSDIADVPSPGGWLQTYGVRVARSLVIGVVGIAASLQIYGSFQGRQASQFAEVALNPVTKSGAQITAWAWPLTSTGFIVADDDSYAYIDNIPSPASDLIISVGTKTSTGTSVASIPFKFANTVVTLRGSGAVKLPARIRVAPGQYVTFGWYAGSGQTTGGVSAGYARIKVEPCGTNTTNCH